jgi:hypothetical protein
MNLRIRREGRASGFDPYRAISQVTGVSTSQLLAYLPKISRSSTSPRHDPYCRTAPSPALESLDGVPSALPIAAACLSLVSTALVARPLRALIPPRAAPTFAPVLDRPLRESCRPSPFSRAAQSPRRSACARVATTRLPWQPSWLYGHSSFQDLWNAGQNSQDRHRSCRPLAIGHPHESPRNCHLLPSNNNLGNPFRPPIAPNQRQGFRSRPKTDPLQKVPLAG